MNIRLTLDPIVSCTCRPEPTHNAIDTEDYLHLPQSDERCDNGWK